ncbi:hypothetical protein Tcan_06355 [Toxocara canis]|uniref:Uncharacterized protein n=1 Tax=Toxocara canis TaxID=6265 RepID=A0A0B2VVR1_TOXCA|nr:hypothetical protein Tcan_06355 [Toxocara canis]
MGALFSYNENVTPSDEENHDDSSQKLARGGSWMSKQKYALPRDVKHSDPVSPASTAPIGSLQDSYPESSSPTVSTATESSSTLPISAVFEKEPTVPSLDAGSAPDQEIIPPALPTSLPPSLPTTSSPAVSPTMIPKSLPPKIPRIMPSAAPKASRLPIPKYSPKLALKIEEVQRDGIDEFVEVSHFTYSKPSLSTRHCQQVEFCERLQPKRKSIIVEFKENHHNNTFSSNESNQTNVIEEDEEFMEILRPERELTHVEMPPRIVGIKVEKIPSSPSPKLIERKLPPLPKMLDIPVKEQKNGAALYIEQKESLRKTIVPPKTTESDVILRKEHRARLDANRSLLERQQEELRALGVLP